MTVTGTIVRKVVGERFEDLPPETVDRVKSFALDDLACGFLGYYETSRRGAALLNYARTVGGTPEATIIGDGLKVSCGVAAGVNSQMAYEPDYNETGPGGGHGFTLYFHTGVAVGERVGASGKDLITAIALSYEIASHFNAALKPESIDLGGFRQDRRQTAVGCAICAAKLMGLDVELTSRAIGLSWILAPQASGFMLRPIHKDGSIYRMLGTNSMILVAPFGVQAALLASLTYEGPEDIIDHDATYDLEKLSELDAPSPYFYLTRKAGMKYYLGPYMTGGVIQLALGIMEEEGLRAEHIDQITASITSVYRLVEPPFSSKAPKDYWEASYAIPWLVAMHVLHGVDKAGPEFFSEEALSDPETLDLANRIRIVYLDPVVDREKLGITVEVAVGGRIHRKFITISQITGTADRPMTKEQLEGKFRRLAAPVIGEGQSNEIIAIVNELERVDDLRELTRLYAPSGG